MPTTPTASAPAPAVCHFFSVDLEEHFQVSAFEQVIPRAQWDEQPSRVEKSTDRLLQLLADHDSLATFFVVGWLAQRKPELVRRVAAAGHEIASHSWWHRRVNTLTPAEFREDARDSKRVLEDLTGRAVLGYRAPSFSILPGGEWAFDVLLEEGYRYDSSLFPIRRPGYGYPAAPTVPHSIRRPGGILREFPLATTVLAGMRLPAAGGGYLRQLPLGLIQRAFREYSGRGVPAMFYIHPWELDPGQPRLPVSWITRQRHYRGLERTEGRLERLLQEFRFTSVERQLAAAAPTSPLSG